jgi:hypothetical protein
MLWSTAAAALSARLLACDVTFHPRTVLRGLTPGRAEIAPQEAPGRGAIVEYDDLVLMSGGVPDRALQSELATAAPVVRVIGDASTPRRLEVAFVEGRQVVDGLRPGWTRPFARYGWSGSAT